MRVEGPNVSPIQKGGNQPELKDLKFVMQMRTTLQSLQAAKRLAKAAQKGRYGAPKPGLGSSSPIKAPASPLVNDYQKYIQDLINFLIGPKPTGEGIPAAALQFIQTELSNIAPSAPNAGSQLAQILHQLFAIGVQVDPDFIKKVTTPGTTPGSDPQQIESDASSQVKTLQAELNNIIAGMGAEGKVFQDMINIQGFLLDYPNDVGDGTSFKQMADSILDLMDHMGDPSPWGTAVNSMLTQLSSIQNGTPLSDIVATCYFLEIYGQHGNDEIFVDARNEIQAPTAAAIAKLNATGNPFFQAMATKLNWWKTNFYPAIENFDDCGLYSGMIGGKLKSNWAAIVSGECGFSPSNVTAALNNIKGIIAGVEGLQYQQLAEQLTIAQQALNSFQLLMAGNWQGGFPNGPYVQGPKAPASHSAALQAIFAALAKIMLKNASDPNVQAILNQLWQLAAGPPYPQTILASLQEDVASYTAFHPLDSSDQQYIEQAYSQIDASINKLSDQQKADQAAISIIQNMLNQLKNMPNCSVQNYESSAASLWKLIQTYEATKDPALKKQIGQMFAFLQSAPGLLGPSFGPFLFAQMLAAGQTHQQIETTMENFIKANPDLQSSPFAFAIVQEIVGYAADKGPPHPSRWVQSLKDGYKGHEDEVKKLLNGIGQISTMIGTEAAALAQSSKEQQDFENELEKILPRPV